MCNRRPQKNAAVLKKGFNTFVHSMKKEVFDASISSHLSMHLYYKCKDSKGVPVQMGFKYFFHSFDL